MAVIDELHLRRFAAGSEYTEAELGKTAERLQEAIQSRFNAHYEDCHLRSGTNYWLLEERHGVWMGFTIFDLQDEMRKSDADYTPEALQQVAYSFLSQFQGMGLTVQIPGTVARQLENPVYYPIFVPYPDDWEEAEYHTVQEFKRLVWRYKMSPAEALDYWMVERQGGDAISWANNRDVHPEAVRKNVRQAREKFDDDDLGASHENETIRCAPLDEVPDGEPHAPAEDVFYVPELDFDEDIETELESV